MQKKIQLTIDKPCSERWNDFKPTAQGGYCSSCQKEVIDFSGWSEERLKAYFRNPISGTCGRFKENQLKVYTFGQDDAPFIRGFAFVLASALVLFSPRQTTAQTGKPKVLVEQLQSDSNLTQEVKRVPDSVRVSGTVTLYNDSSFLAGVNILYKGTILATTDEFGKFAFTLPQSDSMQAIIFLYPSTRRVRHIIEHSQSQENLDIVMGGATQHMLLGGAISVCVISKPWYNPKRWWSGIKSWF